MPSFPSRRAALARRAFLPATLLQLAACDGDSPLASTPAAPPVAASVASLSAGRPDVIPGQYIVVFRDSVSDAPGLARRLTAAHGGELKFTYAAALKGFAARLPDQAVAALERNPRVAYLEADRVVQTAGVQSPVPNWGLDRIDQASLPLNGAYAYANVGAGVNIYIIDSGIHTSHQEFEGRAFGAYSAINDGHGTDDCYYHGTNIASIAGGRTVGVAKGATLWAVRIFDCNGGSSSSALLAGIEWVTRNRRLPAVANMSLHTVFSATINTAVASSIASGVTYAVAAGNKAADACQYSPASLPEAITVAASTETDGQLGVSNFGSCVDLYAPGSNIRSAFISSDDAYVNGSGTSSAAPHVAGTAALVLSANPGASPVQVAQLIRQSAIAGVLTGLGPGSPNLLLSVSAAGAVADVPPPADTAITPPSDTAPASPEPTPPPADTTVTEPPPTADAPPTASFTSKCQAARSKCGFDGRASADDRGITTYTWSFGDGSAPVTATTPNQLYTYRAAGTYVVHLKVTDTAGQESTASRTVSVKRL